MSRPWTWGDSWQIAFAGATRASSALGASVSPPVTRLAASWSPPVTPTQASWSPPVTPYMAAWSPPVPQHRTVSPPVTPRPPRAPGFVETRDGLLPADAQPPWLGIDPDWVWGSDAAMRAQALRRSRERVAPLRDPRIAPALRGDVMVTQGDGTDPLWRWKPEFRLAAVLAELGACLVVDELRLWLVPRPSTQPTVAPAAFFLLQPPPARFRYDVQLDKVLRAAVEREVRMPEILVQSDDMGSFFDALTGIDAQDAPFLAQMMQMAWALGHQVVMAFKNRVAEWRPYQRSARVQPVIPMPGHGSLPSGHATMSALSATLLSALLYPDPTDARRAMLDRLARRIAFNRVVAGVHYPMDSWAGYGLGNALGQALVALAGGQPVPVADDCIIGEGSELPELAAPDPGLPPAPQKAPPPGGAAPAARTLAAVDVPLWRQVWAAAEHDIQNARLK